MLGAQILKKLSTVSSGKQRQGTKFGGLLGGTGVRKSSREEGQKAPSGKAQGGGSLWGLTEGERQSDWKNAEVIGLDSCHHVSPC